MTLKEEILIKVNANSVLTFCLIQLLMQSLSHAVSLRCQCKGYRLQSREEINL